MSNWHKIGALLIAGGLLGACQDEQFEGPANGSGKLIALSGEIDQQNVSRVDDGGFCDGDVMGVYIVDYVNGEPGELLDAGNRATNVKFTFDEAAYRSANREKLAEMIAKDLQDTYARRAAQVANTAKPVVKATHVPAAPIPSTKPHTYPTGTETQV